MTGSDAETNMSLDFSGTWSAVTSSNASASSDTYPILQGLSEGDQLSQLGVATYWIDKYTVDLSGEYRVAVPESISSDLKISDTVPDATGRTVSPGEEVTLNSSELYVRWNLVPGESIDKYSVEIDNRTDLGDLTVAGTTKSLGRVGSAGTTFTTSVEFGTGYDISTTKSPDAFDVEIQGTKIREAGGAIVLENGDPQPRGSLYYAPNGESILEIPGVDANNWKFELVEGSGSVSVDDLDLSEYVKRSELESNDSDIELISEDEGGIPPSDGGGPLDQVGDFFRGIGRSISETVNSIRRRVTGS
jgi:hypothetical protein